MRLAAANEARDSALLAQGAISQATYDQTRQAYDAARADLQGASAAVVAQQAAIEGAQRAVAQASETARSERTQLGYYQVTAPLDGVVGDIPVRVGDYASPQTRLTTVDGNNVLEAYVPVPVERQRDLHMGQEVELRDAGGELLGSTRVFFIAPSVSEDSQTVLVKSRVEGEPSQAVKSSQFLRARVIWSTQPGLRVPVSAVTRINGQPFVFVVTDGQPPRAHQQLVTLGTMEDNRVVVEKGLHEGDRVVVGGVQKLREGAPVQATGE
jgi:RND family efflux transporter MFP subunit